MKPYWKIKGIYEVDVTIEFNVVQLDEFLKTIASKWKCYGEPMNEILISKKDENITIYNKKIEMINNEL